MSRRFRDNSTTAAWDRRNSERLPVAYCRQIGYLLVSDQKSAKCLGLGNERTLFPWFHRSFNLFCMQIYSKLNVNARKNLKLR